MKTLCAVLIAATVWFVSTPAEATTRKCSTSMVAFENGSGQLQGYYYIYSFPYGDSNSQNCNCDDGVYLSYYVGSTSTGVTLGTATSLCTGTGPFYLYVPIASGQSPPPAGAFFVYTHGGRTWRAHCGTNASGKIDCTNSGVEYAEW